MHVWTITIELYVNVMYCKLYKNTISMKYSIICICIYIGLNASSNKCSINVVNIVEYSYVHITYAIFKSM